MKADSGVDDRIEVEKDVGEDGRPFGGLVVPSRVWARLAVPSRY